MAKALDSAYMPGNRGKLWFKVKPAETIDCVIVAADRGSGRRRGWLSNYHLAVADEAGGYAPVGKTFKGLTDKQFIEMTARLQALQLSDDGYTVERAARGCCRGDLQRNPTKPAVQLGIRSALRSHHENPRR